MVTANGNVETKTSRRLRQTCLQNLINIYLVWFHYQSLERGPLCITGIEFILWCCVWSRSLPVGCLYSASFMILQFAHCLLTHVTFLRISPPLLYTGPSQDCMFLLRLQSHYRNPYTQVASNLTESLSRRAHLSPPEFLYTLFHSAWVECIWSQQSDFPHSESNWIRFDWTRFA